MKTKEKRMHILRGSWVKCVIPKEDTSDHLITFSLKCSFQVFASEESTDWIKSLMYSILLTAGIFINIFINLLEFFHFLSKLKGSSHNFPGRTFCPSLLLWRSAHSLLFSDDTSIVRCISESSEKKDRSLVERLTRWCRFKWSTVVETY